MVMLKLEFSARCRCVGIPGWCVSGFWRFRLLAVSPSSLHLPASGARASSIRFCDTL
jgi:hypothetical protein